MALIVCVSHALLDLEMTSKIPKASIEDMKRLEREAKKPKKRRGHAEIPDPEGRKEIKSSLGYSRVGMWGRK